MTSDAADDPVYSLLDDTAPLNLRRATDWERSVLQRVAQHVREVDEGRASRGWESQAVERLARYLRTRQQE